jgi:hypothetical protein
LFFFIFFQRTNIGGLLFADPPSWILKRNKRNADVIIFDSRHTGTAAAHMYYLMDNRTNNTIWEMYEIYRKSPWNVHQEIDETDRDEEEDKAEYGEWVYEFNKFNLILNRVIQLDRTL